MSKETKQFYDFTADDSVDEIKTHLKDRLKMVIGSETRTPVEKDFITIYFIELLRLKSQKDLLQNQNDFNKEMIEKQKGLVKATWALVIVAIITLLIANLNSISQFLSCYV